ncbi:hypothetical protein AB0D67_37830 [Streptosporangium sp. NPDC048047]|uniref:hypothetical protein n=1 Tax=Streptosporangium sp. NPDC048047 TaxID=3155748 RepID=UPI00343224E4
MDEAYVNGGQDQLKATAAAGDMIRLDRFAEDILGRCRWAKRHNDGRPSGAWSTGEQLAVALVLRDRAHLDGMGYTVQEAYQRVYGGMISPPPYDEFGAWFNSIRGRLADE